MAKKEPKVSYYDPAVKAFRDCDLATAKEYVKGLEDVKRQINEIEADEVPVPKPAK